MNIFGKKKEVKIEEKKEEPYVPLFVRDALREKERKETLEKIDIETRKRNGTYYKPGDIKYGSRECPVCSSPELFGYREYEKECQYCTVCGKCDLVKCKYKHICFECHYKIEKCIYCKEHLELQLTNLENYSSELTRRSYVYHKRTEDYEPSNLNHIFALKNMQNTDEEKSKILQRIKYLRQILNNVNSNK